MTTVGIIAEYNPLHNGHVHHFEEAKRLSGAERAVVVMSGPFTQRGEPAVAGKRARTEMALHMGADLVLELPVAYALQPAEWFAFGAVSLLDATGVVDSLCFGSEAGSLAELLPLAVFLAEESSELKDALRRHMAAGASFPAAFSLAAAEAWTAPGVNGPEAAAELLRQPNNSLGLHYLIALQRLGSAIRPLTVPRTGAGFHDPLRPGSPIASATAIRRLLLDGGSPAAYLPAYSSEILAREQAAGRGPVQAEDFAPQLRHALLTRSTAELRGLLDVNEGLEHRVKKALPGLEPFSVASMLLALKSKRYTHTRLQRMLMHILLNHGKDELSPARLAEGPAYIRVLGFRDSGRELLKAMKRTASLPVITSAARFDHPMLERDVQAAAVHAAAYHPSASRELFADYLEPPVMG